MMIRLFGAAVAVLALGNAARYINHPGHVESVFGFLFLFIGVALVVALAADLDDWWDDRSSIQRKEERAKEDDVT